MVGSMQQSRPHVGKIFLEDRVPSNKDGIIESQFRCLLAGTAIGASPAHETLERNCPCRAAGGARKVVEEFAHQSALLSEHAATQLRFQGASIGCQLYVVIISLYTENSIFGFFGVGVGLLLGIYSVFDYARTAKILADRRKAGNGIVQCPLGFGPDICFSKCPPTPSRGNGSQWAG